MCFLCEEPDNDGALGLCLACYETFDFGLDRQERRIRRLRVRRKKLKIVVHTTT